MNKQKLSCILLHGWGINKSIWNNVLSRLHVFNDIDAVCLYTIAEEAKASGVEVLAEYIKNKIEKDTVIIAWSFGGLVATRIATLTDRIKGIVYIASTPCFLNRPNWNNVLDKKSILSLQCNLLKNPKDTIEYFSGLIAQSDKDTKKMLRTIRPSVAHEKYSPILFAWLNELVQIDQRKEFEALRLPTQYLLAEQDVLISPDIAKQLKQLRPQMKCEIIKNSCHVPFVHQPHETFNIIDRFISAQIR
jgi:pimeloyl-[acyl-carrier protein] methyl ester esterase|tara:strand:+ start:141 stop:881 length:741 start_codon:yes stop_codon:yes gene_type:complete